ncbi:hypothetical protein M422DRAFT_32282, partial [Sphaerobolus stellatus SS14]
MHEDENNQIFSVKEKNRCCTCVLQNQKCSFVTEQPVDLIMLKPMNNEELHMKLKELCDMQDVYWTKVEKDPGEKRKVQAM